MQSLEDFAADFRHNENQCDAQQHQRIKPCAAASTPEATPLFSTMLAAQLVCAAHNETVITAAPNHARLAAGHNHTALQRRLKHTAELKEQRTKVSPSLVHLRNFLLLYLSVANFGFETHRLSFAHAH
jgi:hypothetical protein